ncbi:hypothetical protein [Mesorhizobium sp.]|uniref:hypothetical protein n=1 Tax=Mesorhizobium sp. TaxID=1871066 RepID=UPI001204EAC9|nr:hypothetical protein [Mesorhizobium sp.]TIL34299.1 MAG: hypothetical protein E5Y85_11200 [Mesorhizobium sp.]
MTVQELIEQLQKYQQSGAVLIADRSTSGYRALEPDDITSSTAKMGAAGVTINERPVVLLG